ncbi:membrane protein PM19L-like [Apium graveolens]|uniref:membrane protein PM19L-like n=1 Tax=Apium graveolens TaxID=4045 RepID=UPI003D7A3692
MASGAGKSAALLFLVINLILYLVVIILAAWDVDHAMEKTHETASVLTIPARIFPIYFPKGNMATGFFVIYSLIAGVVGFMNSVTGIYHVMAWNPPSLHAAAASSLATWTITLLSMGLACKEINIGYADSSLRTLEIMVIILSGSQLICLGAIQAGVQDIENEEAFSGRV